MIKRRSLDTRDMKILVLDEADEMLNKGFREQIYDVYRYLPPDIQVILVSATLPHDVLEMTHKFMQDPVRVLVKRDELTLEVCHLTMLLIYCAIPTDPFILAPISVTPSELIARTVLCGRRMLLIVCHIQLCVLPHVDNSVC